MTFRSFTKYSFKRAGVLSANLQLLVLLHTIFLPGISSAVALTVPGIFGDHMVLQRGEPVPVWGWARPGETITVRFAGQEKQATAADNGRWEVRLDPLAASAQPAELTIAGSQTLVFKDVLVGEVWLCSGQSNMEKPLGEQRGQLPTFNYQAELRAADYPEIRLIKVPRARDGEPARDFKGDWAACSSNSLDAPNPYDHIRFSAIGYFFARKLYQQLGVPIGIIDDSYGGSRIEPWINPAGFDSVPSLSAFAQAARTPGARVEDTELCTMYNGMIAPLVPFALRGVLWYQGESNVYAGDGSNYADKMIALIQGWRQAWGRELPFYYVQIAPLLYHVTRTQYVVSPEAEPELWEAQTACLKLPRTGMVVTTDLVDDLTNIHPRDKKDVGERLARWALARDYGFTNIVVSGPLFRSMQVKGNQAILHFDYVDGGLVCKGGRPLDWFVIGGADGRLYPGIARIVGDTVVVTSPHVSTPTVVHFAWDEAAQPNFFNQAGLPAVPFRTDNPFSRNSGVKTSTP